MPTTSQSVLPSPFTHSIQRGFYRFSLLAEGLVRIEYAPDQAFEDRPSFVALKRPAALPFREECEDAGGLILVSGDLRIHCVDTKGAPTGDNLRIEFPGGAWAWESMGYLTLGLGDRFDPDIIEVSLTDPSDAEDADFDCDGIGGLCD